MEMEDQYGISDLRQFIARAQYPPPYPPQPPPPFSAHHHLAQAHPQAHYEMSFMGRHATTNTNLLHHEQFNSDSTTTTATATPTATATATATGVVAANSSGCGFDGGGDGGSARWPRQETLTLLEIRSRLDCKFKEANQKGPLWDEVARIMSEEHGYQRSGKKCREKFENLYKYYKKTKEGKAGRQDGKHYRFFRQLEALYGNHHQPISTSDAHFVENTPHFHHNPMSPQPSNTHHQQQTPLRVCGDTSASLSTSSDFDTSSSDNNKDSNGSKEREGKKTKRRDKRNWKAKIKEFIDLQMRKVMEKQEAWLEKMMKTLEKRELERMEREEEWRKQEEAVRAEREHKFWATERAWIEARDSALMKALERISDAGTQWPEYEITRLIQLRTNMEARFQQCGTFSEEILWEDIAAQMGYYGYERSASDCKGKWDGINRSLQEGKGKRKEKIHISHNYGVISDQLLVSGLNNTNNKSSHNNNNNNNNEGSSSPSSHNSNINVNAAGSVMNDSCLRFFLGDGDQRIIMG